MLKKKKRKKYKPLRVIARIIIGVLSVFIITILLIRSPWGQDFIVNKIVDYVSEKTNTRIEIERLFVTFSGNIFLEGFYLEDKKGDTLVYSKNLEASLQLIPLIKGDKINLKSLDWSGFKANIRKEQYTNTYNFDFLIQAFATDTVAIEEQSKTSESPKIEIGTIHLNDFNLDYNDEISGIESTLQLGDIFIEMKELDLDNMKFHIEDISIADSNIKHRQAKPSEKENDTPQQDSPLPLLIVDQLKIKNVKTNYESLPDQVFAAITIGDFLLELPEMNLESQAITVKTIALRDSDISFRSIPKSQIPDTITTATPITFEWPEWNIKTDQIILEKNHIVIQTGDDEASKNAFNPKAMEFHDFNIDVKALSLTPEKGKLLLHNFSFQEKSGFQLQKSAFKLQFNDQSISLSDLNLVTNKSRLKGNLGLNYQSIDQLLNTPEFIEINIDIPILKINPKDAYFFQPVLNKNKYINVLSKKNITGNVLVKGMLNNLEITNTRMNWGASTAIHIDGTIKNVLDVNTLLVDVKPFEITTTRVDMLQFISEEELGVSIPETVLLQGSFRGATDTLTGSASLQIPEGIVKVVGTFSNTQNIAFEGDLEVQKLQLGKLLKNEQLGTLSFTAKASGSGSSIHTLNTTFQSNFSTLQLNQYDFSDLSLEGAIKNGKGKVNLLFKDKNLDIALETKMELDSIAPKFNVLIDLKGADLNALGITEESIKTKLKINTDFVGNATHFDVKSAITQGVTVYNDTPYNINDLTLEARVRKDTTSLQIASQMLDADLRSNTNPTLLIEALQRKFKSYISDTTAIDSISYPVYMKMDIAMRPTPILDKVFMKGLEKFDTITMKVDFNESKQLLSADVSAPQIQYKESIVDSLQFHLKGNKNDLSFNLGWSGLESGPIAIKKTYFDGTLADKTMVLNFNAFDENEKLAHIQSEIQMINDTIQYHINPSDLIINKEQWTIPADNTLQIADKSIDFKNFVLGRNQQEINIRTDIPGKQKEHLGVSFKNFDLATFTSLLNPDEIIANGILKGDLIVEDLYGDSGILADLNIQSLTVMEILLGNLAVQAKSKSGNRYDFDLALKGENADLDLKGGYIASETGAQLNLDLLLNELKIKTFEELLGDVISETEGSLSGKVKVTGTTKDPQYSGNLNFEETSLLVNAINAKFTFPDEIIKIDNSGIYLNNFTITDASKNIFKLDGKILTDNLTNPSFDLTLNAEKFQVLNSTKEDNDLFYGKVKLNADVTIKGDLKIPKIDGKLKINEGSDFTLIVPESQLDVVEREGILLFVNKKDPDAILTRVDEK